MFTDINIYFINNKTDHISEKHILYRKKSWYFPDFRSDLEQDPDPLFHETDPSIRIDIKMKRIRNTVNNLFSSVYVNLNNVNMSYCLFIYILRVIVDNLFFFKTETVRKNVPKRTIKKWHELPTNQRLSSRKWLNKSAVIGRQVPCGIWMINFYFSPTVRNFMKFSAYTIIPVSTFYYFAFGPKK